jgi:hypothetical protein
MHHLPAYPTPRRNQNSQVNRATSPLTLRLEETNNQVNCTTIPLTLHPEETKIKSIASPSRFTLYLEETKTTKSITLRRKAKRPSQLY